MISPFSHGTHNITEESHMLLRTTAVRCMLMLSRAVAECKAGSFLGGIHRPVLWEFQDPKLEVPTMYKAYFSGLCKGISQQNMIL